MQVDNRQKATVANAVAFSFYKIAVSRGVSILDCKRAGVDRGIFRGIILKPADFNGTKFICTVNYCIITVEKERLEELLMKHSAKQMLTFGLLCVLMLSVLPISASANSAEPPSLVILINNPPDDLSIEITNTSGKNEATFRQVAWEGYYIVYHDFRTDGIYKLRVTTQGKSFDCQTSQPLKHHCSVFTLNLSTQKLAPGTAPLHSALIIFMRLVLTLLIEGALFWLFGYRNKRSWFVFLFVNLATQGLLSFLLIGDGNTSTYLLYELYFAEIPVFLLEMILMPILLKEHSKTRTVLFAFIANQISLIAGSYIITILPV